jgi:hypothetical protein
MTALIIRVHGEFGEMPGLTSPYPRPHACSALPPTSLTLGSMTYTAPRAEGLRLWDIFARSRAFLEIQRQQGIERSVDRVQRQRRNAGQHSIEELRYHGTDPSEGPAGEVQGGDRLPWASSDPDHRAAGNF